MTLTVLLFASYADAYGVSQLEVEVPPEGTVADLVTALRQRPSGAMLPARPVVAVNHAYADYSRPLHERDEIALIPPVAGG